MDRIRIRGARTHNLKNIDLDLPRDRLIVLTGLSGSGKSSLAFDTIYAEGQRRYVESLSAYARQFLSVMEKPDVDHIDGLSPAIAIEQKSSSHNPRSTVGTITEVYDYLRLLFARAGTPHCPEHHEPLQAQTVAEMVDQVMKLPEGDRLMLLAPLVSERTGEYDKLLQELHAEGFVRVRIDGAVYELDDLPDLDPHARHSIEAVIDRFRVRPDARMRLAESFETALRLSNGLARVVRIDEPQRPDLAFSARFACPRCSYSMPEPEPRMFSFNNPAGACNRCGGLGVQQFFDPAKVVLHPDLSLAAGAVRGWDRRNAYYFQLIRALGTHYQFDVETPWSQLPEPARQVVLFGSGDETLEFRYLNDQGKAVSKTHAFEGVVRNMARRFRETQSGTVREELARYLSDQPCPACHGTRLNEAARNVLFGGARLPEITAMPVGSSLELLRSLPLAGAKGEIAGKILWELTQRLQFLVDVGLDYLSLDRSADSLSGGEAQRIRLASQIGAGLVGVMYILDEPSIGLHQRDNARLLRMLASLRDLGNTVIVVEHDEEAIRAADEVVDIGPGAGIHGGTVVAQGTVRDIECNPRSLTGRYLCGDLRIEIPKSRMNRAPAGPTVRILGAKGNNLKNIDVEIPVGLFTCITGVSGSGKSTLVNDTLYPAAARILNGASLSAAAHVAIEGLSHFDKVVDIDQSPIGRTPRSNPATYTGLFGPIRDLFAATPEARSRGYGPGRFSFNVRGGRCEACKGDGLIRVEMHFLPDVYVQCDVCHGQRYDRETLDIRYKGKSISAVLDLTVEDARHFFAAVPALKHKLETLSEVGLAYIKLGQNATTLSGGEAQRVKLAKELSRRDTGRTLYILDEPTTGLHFHDVKHLLEILHRLRDQGNTLVVIEHNLDVIKTADWIVDLGPEGGGAGGTVVATGTPETVSRVEASHTGRYLRPLLERGR